MKEDISVVLDKKRKAVGSPQIEEYTKDIEDPWVRADIAVALDNQRLMNASVKMTDDFAAMTVEAAYHALTKSIATKIVSVQTMLGPESACYWPSDEPGQFTKDGAIAKMRPWDYKIEENEVHDPEVIGELLAQQINHEIFNDLINHAGARPIWDFAAVDGDTLKERCVDLIAIVKKTRQVIKAQSKRSEANWCVTSPTCASLLALPNNGMITSTDLQSVNKFGKVGSLWDMDVYCDPKFPRTTILLGYRGDSYDSGYAWLPYIMLSQVQADKGSNMLLRYAKMMRKGGQNYYAKLMIDNF